MRTALLAVGLLLASVVGADVDVAPTAPAVIGRIKAGNAEMQGQIIAAIQEEQRRNEIELDAVYRSIQTQGIGPAMRRNQNGARVYYQFSTAPNQNRYRAALVERQARLERLLNAARDGRVFVGQVRGEAGDNPVRYVSMRLKDIQPGQGALADVRMMSVSRIDDRDGVIDHGEGAPVYTASLFDTGRGRSKEVWLTGFALDRSSENDTGTGLVIEVGTHTYRTGSGREVTVPHYARATMEPWLETSPSEVWIMPLRAPQLAATVEEVRQGR